MCIRSFWDNRTPGKIRIFGLYNIDKVTKEELKIKLNIEFANLGKCDIQKETLSLEFNIKKTNSFSEISSIIILSTLGPATDMPI